MRFEDEFQELIWTEEIAELQKIKKINYLVNTIRHSQKDEYLAAGWEILKEFKTKVKIKKAKQQNDFFEDRIWCLMANLGFKYLNRNRKFKINYDGKLSKQIDVFAANDEVVLIIECKSAETQRSASFQKDINELGHLRSKIIDRVKKYCDGKPKIAFLFCTNKYIISDSDQERMRSSNIIWFNHDDISYFEQLILSIKGAAIYQLLGRIFAKQEIPNMKNLVPAIRGSMGGYSFYSFAIEPRILLQLSYVLHRVQTTDDTIQAYQRIVSAKRISEIQEFINNGNFFPNSIIINIDTKNGAPLQFDLVEKNNCDSYAKLGILHLPKLYRSAYVIDGQHRLYGYAGSKYENTNTIPVIAFENLPSEEQANLFVDINSKQKTVNKNLLNTLDAELRWNSPNVDDAIKALKSKVLQRLTETQNSPLYNLISVGERKQKGSTCLTLSFLCSYGFSKTKFFGLVQKKKQVSLGYLCDGSELAQKTLDKAYIYFKDCFDFIKNAIPEYWKPNGTHPLLLRNIGLAALFRLLNDVLEHLERENGIKCNAQSAKNLFEKTKPYLVHLVEAIKEAPFDEITSMSKQYGAGGPEKVEREFQRWINKREQTFSPIGLSDYIRDSSGQYNEEIHQELLEFQGKVKNFLFEELKRKFGDSWWEDGVPEKVQDKCGYAGVQDRHAHEDSFYLDSFSDYAAIIEFNWSSMGDVFADPTQTGRRKSKIEWLKKFNDFQIRVTRPERAPITMDEYNFIQATLKRVLSKLL